MNKISDMRQNYDRAILDEEHVDPNPMVQFNHWFEDAKNQNIAEPNAMILSTINKKGNPSSRTVLLKGLEEDRFIFYTNYESDKGKEIEANPNVSLLFLWINVHRQIRISGVAQKVSKAKSEAYFQSRPKGSQIGAWVSPQSQVIPDKSILENRKKEISEKYKNEETLPLPEHWGGYYLKPESMEFWQGRPDRLHDRLRYTREEGNWSIERLAP